MIMDEKQPKARFIPFKCPNCNGYKTTSYGKMPCLVCKQRGFIVINQETGFPVDDDDYEYNTTT